MHDMYELKETLCKELDEQARKPLNMQTLETIHVLTDAIKNIGKIEMLEEASEYSNDYSNNSYGDGSYRYFRRRDSLGRYTRDREPMMSHRYSRESANEHMLQQLGEMMENANDERERSALRRAMTVFEQK